MLLTCVVFSLSFATLETIYRLIKNNSTTTIGQTIITFVWSPIIITHYKLIPYPYSILLFPINVWSCEIVSGYFVLYLFNKRLWNYTGKYVYFNRMISLYWCWYWLFLGCVINQYFKYVLV